MSVLLATTSQFAQVVLELVLAMKSYPEIRASFLTCKISFSVLKLANLLVILNIYSTGQTVLSAAGCLSDIVTLRRTLNARLTEYGNYFSNNIDNFVFLKLKYMSIAIIEKCIRTLNDMKINFCYFRYENSHAVKMSGKAVSQLLSTTLYHRRFFHITPFAWSLVSTRKVLPYILYIIKLFVFNGQNKLYIGKGAVYVYDAVGSFKRDEYGCMGSGQNFFVMPILDNLVTHKSFKINHTYLKSLR